MVAASKLGAGFVGLILAGQKQAQRKMRLKGIGIGGDGAAVEGGGIVETILRVGDIAGVEEGARVGGMGGEIGIEFGFGCLPVGGGDGRFCRSDCGGRGLGWGGGRAARRRCGAIGRCGVLGKS